MKIIYSIFLICIFGILSACTTSKTSIISSKSEDYTKEPKRILVFSDAGLDFSSVFLDSFKICSFK